ncbi:nucleotidyltransferase domain-containing protein [Bergeyella zoohelcum]|uniref:Polymerase beta nucleotidyltransferase domain-containing protein n=2 Tax=Bergeyella zoohelcum TaxID=1015 RepID=K1MPW0_9FLAO|nr:nucleotidyltransferase domain-containing protein [Bergeyella zoohelcum]EKB58164.1 hypothetical protein HMPREF9699_00654 [Bergeyella zoohelcum ATCC 43767]EKB61704.1 hypothetical protein HMPREF9700_00066 [Bergeyella zoohelcum CCUG 30536]MDY6025208.1 nucleotidyltransferase domain-containing protein [Bergeyella zoohelcum]SUV49159.1 Predicted nucleotidyltransferases [Bergeyella zoohelcum]SUV52325.1 Predicted nucleotidyltransferases [Bergeyella zoohelcum]
MSKFGLKAEVIEQMNNVFSRFKNIEKVLIYGSRAKGNFRYNSDIDLSLLGAISYNDLLKIEMQLDDLLLPYKIDLSVFEKIENEDLKEHIRRVGKVFAC